MGWLAQSENPPRKRFDAAALLHLDALYANAMQLTRSKADAEDLVQETMVKAFRFFDRFEQGTNLRAWLFRIQYNTFVNLYRRAGRHSAAIEGQSGSSLAEDFVGESALRALNEPEREALRPLISREIDRAFEELPEEYRSVLLLADVEEYSYREIADIVGCPLGTVMSRLHRARRALRRAILERAGQNRSGGNGFAESGEPGADVANGRSEPGADAVPVSLEAYRRSRSNG